MLWIKYGLKFKKCSRFFRTIREELAKREKLRHGTKQFNENGLKKLQPMLRPYAPQRSNKNELTAHSNILWWSCSTGKLKQNEKQTLFSNKYI